MICNSTYDSADAIPEALREEFEQINGKWQLKSSAIPGVGSLFNKALQENHDKAVGQVKTRNEKIHSLEATVNDLNDKLGVFQTPGSTILSKEDTALWEQYMKLGTPKEVKAKLDEHGVLSEKVAIVNLTQSLEKVAKGVNLNSEVLADWAVSAGGEHEFVLKDVKMKDSKGAEVLVPTAFVKVAEKKDGGKVEISEHELLPYLKEHMKEYQYTALTTTADGKSVVPPPVYNGGVRVPNLGSGVTPPAGGGDQERPVETFNKQRNAAVNPFMPAAAK